MAQIDSSFLADKVALRAEHMPDGAVSVLDCFGGKGLVWQCVRRITGRKIDRLAIDVKAIDDFHLHGDNIDFLHALELTRFNVVDLDAYGWPIDQLRVLLSRGYAGRVFATVIQSTRGGVNHKMMRELGFSGNVVEKAVSLFARRAPEFFREWLAQNGVRSITHRSKQTAGFRKMYCVFDLNGAAARASDSGSRPVETVASRA